MALPTGDVSFRSSPSGAALCRGLARESQARRSGAAVPPRHALQGKVPLLRSIGTIPTECIAKLGGGRRSYQDRKMESAAEGDVEGMLTGSG